MTYYRLILSILALISFFSVGLYSQEILPTETMSDPTITIDGPAEIIKTDHIERADLASISSTSTGGFWNTPSTWVGGVVPGAGDNVTITAGSTVEIDVAATVGNLTVGDGTLNPAVLILSASGSGVLTVNGDLTISGGLSTLTTPTTGSTPNNTIIVGGNLTNNGILDLSTNNNQAGAGLTFKNSSNNTFSGSGSVTDIRSIRIDKGNSPLSTLEVNVSNFTVRGASIDDGSGESYLTLLNGTFKISGLFSGNHRTFAAAPYTIPLSAGIWLNNPNYTIAGQAGNVTVIGNLTVSAGVYNVGTAATNTLTGGDVGGLVTVDGGSLNVSGAIRRGTFPATSYRQTAGVTTTCIAGSFAPCFNMLASGSGGKLVIQTASTVSGPPDFLSSFSPEAKTMVTFGNANTPGTSVFTQDGVGNSVAIDTTAGQHTLRLPNGGNFSDVNIGPGGTLDLGLGGFVMSGTSFVNNGILKVRPEARVSFGRDNSIQPIIYSGTGVFSGPIANLDFLVPSTTLDPGVTSIRTRNITTRGSIINANRITLGIAGSFGAIAIEMAGSLDTAPVFDIGAGQQALSYRNLSSSRTIGPELNPTREIQLLEFAQSDERTLTISGGDLTVNGMITCSGTIDTGSNKLRHLSGSFGLTGINAFVQGTLVRRFTSSGDYSFNVGDGHRSSMTVTVLSLPSGPADVAVTARDATLAGLPPDTSVSFSWDIQQIGAIVSRMEIYYRKTDINGNDSNYRAWRSAGGAPATINSTVNENSNRITVPSVTDLTGSWGISERLANVSISGTVRSSGGSGIRNAIVTLSGGNLQTPLVAQTGNFGTYSFAGVEGGFQYTIRVSAKRQRFATPMQMIIPTMNVTNLDFVANPQEEFRLR